MAKWKLSRQIFGCEEFNLSAGDNVTVGRGNNNTITLASAVISRNHCVINFQNNKAQITDLQSSNGVYVGTTKIPPNEPYDLKDSDIIGLGWTIGAPLVNIKDSEKYVFKLVRHVSASPLTSRLTFQDDIELDDIEAAIAKFDKESNKDTTARSPLLCTKLSLKRKIDNNTKLETKKDAKDKVCNDIIINISDSEHEIPAELGHLNPKKSKMLVINEESQKQLLKESEIKSENQITGYDAFIVKQEYSQYDDEPINVSDSDSESEQWLIRLSQNSPGKPFTKISKTEKHEIKQEDGSYSQLDDDFIVNHLIFEDDEDIVDDIISVPEIEEKNHEVPDISKLPGKVPEYNEEEFSDDIISIEKPQISMASTEKDLSRDELDGCAGYKQTEERCTEKLLKSPPNEIYRKAQMIKPLVQLPQGKTKSPTLKQRSSKVKKTHSKKETSTAQKEERKKKLKEIALKVKNNDAKSSRDSLESSKPITNVKVTSSNRGAFLSEVVQATVKPIKRKEHLNRSKDKVPDCSPKDKEIKSKEITENSENRKNTSERYENEKGKRTKHKDKSESYNNLKNSAELELRQPLKSLRPLTEGEDTLSGKPVSKVGPMPIEKPKKKVNFSTEPPQIRVFEIEPGNKMKKTSLVKTTLVDIRQTPVFSLEKITLMKILRWNPHWLEEQINNNDPPPILGHNNTSLSLFHSFVNHNQYVQQVGDLLLMEIWECLTIAYMKIRNQNNGIQMRIESLPAMPAQERYFELLNLSVNVSVPPSETRYLPRVGEIMLISFGSDNVNHKRFFFVHNVRQLPAAPGQTQYFYSISLHATMTEKMLSLRSGEIIIGRSLAYINKELSLFEAMDYLAGSPLSEAILKPEPHHFIRCHNNQFLNLQSQWIATLNPSQLKAVSSSVAAALSDKPSIQMVQGPPGTGKSSVICAIVMSYFYDAHGKKHQHRGKILICATSNAAVDGLVIRLLNLRQSLPKPERFRMVRVGRAESMHAVAANISSQQLALRDLTRINEQPPTAAGLHEEITHLEAKINMWKTARNEAKDPVRIAYCQGRITDLVKRIALLKNGGGYGGAGAARGEGLRAEQLAIAERRIIEGADIIVTTLASAHNYKMKGLKRRIALCIIDEAGQVIEPETLIPLTLDVTKLTLIGDPQQLPGFICSQRAKKHGLGESLFSRLTSYTDVWGKNSPVILLNQQYRMHPDIANYPSRAFYGGMVETIPPCRPDIAIPPYLIVGITSGDKGQGVSGANEMEAWGVTRLVMALDILLRPLKLNLAVITPYNAHKDLIKKNLKMSHDLGESVEVNTIDSFQGQERDVVVVSLARSHGVGFLVDTGRMNVMLTRAKHSLIICLNPYALVKNNQWRTLLDDSQQRDMFKTLPNKLCQPITDARDTVEDILKYITDKRSYGSYR